MNKVEIGKLLTLAAGFDNRKVDLVTTEAWSAVPELVAADYEAAKAVVIAHQTGPKHHEYLTVGHIVDGLRVAGRNSTAEIAADVRSAKARGLVGREWSESERLPEDVRDALFTLRDGERRAAAQRFMLEAAGEVIL